MEERIIGNQPDLLQTPVAVEEKKANIGLLIAISLVVISLFAGGVYAGMKIGRKQVAGGLLTKVTPTSVLQPTVILTSDETVNWKTYRNEKYRFEFKYPQNLSYISLGPKFAQKEVDQGKELSGTIVPSFDTINFREVDKNKKFSVEIFKENETALTPENYQNGLYMSGSCDLRWLDNKPNIVKSTELNGSNLLEVNIAGPKQYVSCYYLKNRDSNLIVISSEIFSDSSTFEKIDGEIKRILSTLKFLPVSSSTDDTANWKTYRNEKYGFEVKYYPELTPNELNGGGETGPTYLQLILFGTGLGGGNYIKSPFGFEVKISNKISLENIKAQIVGHVTDKIDSEVDVGINNNVWKKYSYQVFVATDYVSITKSIIKFKENIYEVTASTDNIDQILSTFGFISNNKKENNFYLGTYQGKDALFFVDTLVISGNGGNYKPFDFKNLVNPRKISSSNVKEPIFDFNNFITNSSKNTVYISANYIKEGSNYPDLNKVIQILTDGSAIKEIWSNDIGSKKYPKGEGAVYLDQVVDDKYISFLIYSCYGCSGSPVGMIVLNVNTKGEKYYEMIGDLQFNLQNNMLTYKKLFPFKEACEPGEGCLNGQMTVYKPAGNIYSDSLP